jgi:ElaB/YqjD/DUF883 family membrane-anchored ribosome-binding protein
MDTATDALTADELQRRVERRREDVGRDLEVIGDRVSPGRIAERTTGRARRRMDSVRDTVMGTAGGAREHASSAGDRLGETEHQVEDQIKGNPLGAGLVAFGIGFLAGSVLPGSRRERELARSVEPAVAQAAATAADEARTAAEQLGPAARDEATALKDEAAQAATTVRERT